MSVETYPDVDTLVSATGDRLAAAITAAITARGQALVVLTGGGTGIALLKRLGSHVIDWPRVHLFWGDDRYVPRHDDDRNEKQAREALLDRIVIPAGNIHPMPADDGQATPMFDVHLLGMGGEGHVNSLFPHTPAVLEEHRLVVGVEDSPKPPPRRITLTLPAVRRARQVWLVVSGAAKADAVAAAIGGADPAEVPAAGAVGLEATLWLLDASAARGLSSSNS